MHWRRNGATHSTIFLLKTFFCGTLVSVCWRSHLILNHFAGFYMPIIPQYQPSHLQDYRTCNSAKLEFPTDFFHAWIQLNGELETVTSGASGFETSSALSTPAKTHCYKISLLSKYVLRNVLLRIQCFNRLCQWSTTSIWSFSKVKIYLDTTPNL